MRNGCQIFQDNTVELKVNSDLEMKGSSSRLPRKGETSKYSGSKEAISTKYAAMREQGKFGPNNKPIESISSAKVSLLDGANSQPTNNSIPSGLASKWASMKQGFQTLKTNIESKKFIPLRQAPELKLSRVSSSESSLDEIFQRLKRPSVDNEDRLSDEDEEVGHAR